MRRRLSAALLSATLLLFASPGAAQVYGTGFDVGREQAEAARAVQENAQGAPARVALLDEGTLRLESGLQFVGRDVAVRYLRAHGMESPPDLVGMLMFGGRSETWYGIIRLVRDGFVDAAAVGQWTYEDVLASIKDDTARENEARARKTLPPRVVEGWRIPPTYDPDTRSILWAVRSYVSGVSTMNESDSTAHLAVFGRNGYFQVDITAAGATLRENARDFPMIANNLRFLEGKRYDDFVAGSDTVSRHGLATVFGVGTLRHVGFMEGELSGERLMIFSIGGALVLGAVIMAGGLVAANRRRNRRI